MYVKSKNTCIENEVKRTQQLIYANGQPLM